MDYKKTFIRGAVFSDRKFKWTSPEGRLISMVWRSFISKTDIRARREVSSEVFIEDIKNKWNAHINKIIT